MTYESERKHTVDDRGELDLSLLIDQHKREIWAYKMKESEWIKTQNQLDGNKRIIGELSSQVISLKKEIDRLSEENNNLKIIDSSHQELNGKLRKQITEVEIEMSNLKAIGNNSPEMRDLQRDNKYLVEKVEAYRAQLRKAGL
tara:strand:- start:131 stop:559 length:429 start_codon:yes stop_codon:yes gene_type:complete